MPFFLCLVRARRTVIVRAGAYSGFLAISVALAWSQSTSIAVNATVIQPQVKRLGINLSFQDYYDSGQMTANLISVNPGFEGEIYNSTIRCAAGTATTCVDDNPVDTAWQSGFWQGASFEVFYGAARGRSGTIISYTAGNGTVGGTFTFASGGRAPATGDYMIVRMSVPGNAQAGWWPSTSGAGSIATNTTDLPPGTTGKQTASLSAPTAGDAATMTSYFDTVSGKTFVQLNGSYQVSFKAKGTGGANAVAVYVGRSQPYLSQTVSLTGSWNTYTLNFTAAEDGSAIGGVAVSFGTVGADSFLLDDTSLTQTDSDPANTTAFRDAVVDTIKDLNPGVMRFWALQLGDTLDNLIAGPFGRQRAGYSAWANVQNSISYGLPEFLQLCQVTGAEPWFVVPSTFSASEAGHLIEYLAGTPETRYGAQRAAAGQTDPWTQSFTKIHLEFGNEEWNGTFKGGSIEYPQPYGNRAQTIFGAMRNDASYNAAAFDLVLGGQAVWPDNSTEIQNNCSNNDSFTIGPYLMATIDSYANTEQLFGPAFAEPEALLAPNGSGEGVTGGFVYLTQQALLASSHPVPLEIYETNLGATAGSITQAALSTFASSAGAGLTVADSMLQDMRAGILTQNMFALPQYQFVRGDGSLVDLWGTVIDMGVTNRKRPQFLAVQMVNQAIGSGAAMLQTVHSGANPTWNQALENTVQLNGAHDLESFAFQNGNTFSLIVLNLARNGALPVTFGGTNPPQGSVTMQQLTSANITDTNETAAVVAPVTTNLANFDPSATLSLPPFSMTLLTWQSGGNPPPAIANVAVSNVSATSAVVSWTTSQPGTSQVEYGETAAYGTSSALATTLVTAHSVTLTGLAAGTLYDYAVLSNNAAGQTLTSANATFTTLAGDGPAPQIFALADWGVTGSGIIISWSTNVASDTAVEYGATTNLGSVSPVGSSLSESHLIVLAGLTPNTLYYFRARSANNAGGTGYSALQTFTTLDTTPPAISNIVVTPALDNTASIAFTVSKPSTCQAQYGPTAIYGQWSSPSAPAQTGQILLPWVVAGTTHYLISCTDSSGNAGNSTDLTFTEP